MKARSRLRQPTQPLGMSLNMLYVMKNCSLTAALLLKGGRLRNLPAHTVQEMRNSAGDLPPTGNNFPEQLHRDDEHIV